MAKRRGKQSSPGSSLRTELAQLLLTASYSDLISVAGEFSDRAADWQGDDIPLKDNENWAMFFHTWAQMVLDEV
mgnify:CR=1 FL=1